MPYKFKVGDVVTCNSAHGQCYTHYTELFERLVVDMSLHTKGLYPPFDTITGKVIAMGKHCNYSLYDRQMYIILPEGSDKAFAFDGDSLELVETGRIQWSEVVAAREAYDTAHNLWLEKLGAYLVQEKAK